MAITIPGLAIKVDGDTDGFQQAMLDVRKGLKETLSASQFAAMASGAGVALLAVEKLFEGVKLTIDTAKQAFENFISTAGRLGDLKDLSGKLNLDPNDLLSIRRGARLTGSNAEAIDNLFGSIQNQIGEGLSGGKNPFDAIGLSVSQLSVMDPVGQLGAIGDALNKIADPALREKLGEDIVGKQFRQLSPLILSGTKGIQGFRAEFDAIGLSIDEGLINRFDRVDDKVKDVQAQFQAINDTLIGGIAPGIESLANVTSDWLGRFDESGPLDRWAARIEVASGTIGNAVTLVSLGLEGVLRRVDLSIKVLSSIPGVKELISDNLPLEIRAPLSALTEFESATTERMKQSQAAREKGVTDREQEKAMRQSGLAKMQLGKMFGGVGADFTKLGGNIADWWATDKTNALGPKLGAPQFAGALEQGTAAAYAAAYQRDSTGDPGKETVKKLDVANTLAKESLAALRAIAKSLPGIRPASI